MIRMTAIANPVIKSRILDTLSMFNFPSKKHRTGSISVFKKNLLSFFHNIFLLVKIT